MLFRSIIMMNMNIFFILAVLLCCQALVSCSLGVNSGSALSRYLKSSSPIKFVQAQDTKRKLNTSTSQSRNFRKQSIPAAACPNTNSLIKLLKLEGTALYSNPRLNNKACGLEWKTLGTCCDLDSLVKTVKSDKISIVDNTLRFAAKHEELHRLSFKFTDTLFKLIWKKIKAKDTFRKLPKELQ